MTVPTHTTALGLPEPLHMALLFALFFFAAALITGIWKWRAMLADREGQAHAYVDIAHHAALHYGPFLVLAGALASFWPFSSAFPAWILVALMGVTMVASLSRYISLGLRGNTDNQLRRPSLLARAGLIFFFLGTALPGLAIALGALIALWPSLPAVFGMTY